VCTRFVINAVLPTFLFFSTGNHSEGKIEGSGERGKMQCHFASSLSCNPKDQEPNAYSQCARRLDESIVESDRNQQHDGVHPGVRKVK